MCGLLPSNPLLHHRYGVDLHQELRAGEPNGDGDGDRRWVGPRAPNLHERLKARMEGLAGGDGDVPLDDVGEVCAAGLQRLPGRDKPIHILTKK